ncbi:MAG: Hpt domain-containing protein [Pirellulales bacterium]|nr:Hpt domain-containing protein [Pirellulales bacterium]
MLREISTPGSSPIDLQELLNRCMGNLDLAQRVLSKLQSQFEADLVELERALAEKNGKLAASVAHRLNGAASNIAAHDLQRCAAQIENSARENLLQEMPAQISQLRNQWSRLNEAALSFSAGNQC